MKFMGAKHHMLRNGLGQAIRQQAEQADRFVDLFAGSAAVTWFAAATGSVSVLSVDLQEFSGTLARAVLARPRPSDPATFGRRWLARVRRSILSDSDAPTAADLSKPVTPRDVEAARAFCGNRSGRSVVSGNFGGHYLSPQQALILDHMLAELPAAGHNHDAYVAAMIIGASRCVSAPGHTAQPFQPSPTALPHIRACWRRDPLEETERALVDLATRYASRGGTTIIDDAVVVARNLNPTDLVFVDPPYSAVQYSRFYHVYEAMATQRCGHVQGAGRYPPLAERPQSDFSKRSSSHPALETLLLALAERECAVLMTFPEHECSNGLSGEAVLALARKHFKTEVEPVTHSFSTMGGSRDGRPARVEKRELILSLSPS